MSLFELKKGWEWTNLEQVASSEKNAIVDGPFGSSMKTSDYVESGVPVLQGKNVTNNQFRWFDVRFISDKKAIELQRSKVRVGDILMVKIGSIGYSAIVDDLQDYPFAIIPANLAKVTVNTSRIDINYLQYWLTSPSIKEYLVNSASKTAQPALSLSKIKNTPVPLSPLPEQKRIAAILDKADSIRRKRQEAVQLTEELLRSVFLDMFGDPVTNPKGWEIKSLSDEIEFLTSGSRGWAEFYSDSGRKFIRIQNVKNGLLHFNDVQYVTPPDNKEAARTKVQENDLLISITADLGRTAVVDKITAIEGAHINQHLALVRLSKAFNPHFVAAYLESEGGKRQFLQLDQSAVKSGMNFDSIKSLHLFSPPLKLQNQYASFVHALENTKGKLRTSLEVTDTFFNSLLQRAFKGEL